MSWISVKDKLPPIDPECKYTSIYVLVTDGQSVGFGQYYFDEDYNYWTYEIPGYIDVSDNRITHWMYFPDLPK